MGTPTSIVDQLVRCAARHGLLVGNGPNAIGVIQAIKAMPYGRATDRRWATLLAEWRGTCSGKHYLLAAALSELGVSVRLRHRVYRLTLEAAASLFPWARAAVPPAGVIDVHTYALVPLNGRDAIVDVTFPGPWDGRSDMEVASGHGLDVAVPPGADPQALKEELIRKHCDVERREALIAALER